MSLSGSQWPASLLGLALRRFFGSEAPSKLRTRVSALVPDRCIPRTRSAVRGGSTALFRSMSAVVLEQSFMGRRLGTRYSLPPWEQSPTASDEELPTAASAGKLSAVQPVGGQPRWPSPTSALNVSNAPEHDRPHKSDAAVDGLPVDARPIEMADARHQRCRPHSFDVLQDCATLVRHEWLDSPQRFEVLACPFGEASLKNHSRAQEPCHPADIRAHGIAPLLPIRHR